MCVIQQGDRPVALRFNRRINLQPTQRPVRLASMNFTKALEVNASSKYLVTHVRMGLAYVPIETACGWEGRMVPLGGVGRNSKSTIVSAKRLQRDIGGLLLVGYFVLASGPVAAQDLNDLIRSLEWTIEKAIEENSKQPQPAPESAPAANDHVQNSPSLSSAGEPPVTAVEHAPSGSIAPQRDEQTARIQRLLTELGFDPGPVDGVFGPRTTAAIQAFQTQQGMPPDGIVSPVLLSALEQAAAVVSTPAAGVATATAEQQALIDALEELEWAIFDKIDHDVATIAQAFYDAYDIEQSRQLADFVMLPVVFVKEAFSLYSAATTWKDVLASIDKADTVLELSSLVMGLAHLKEATEKFQLVWDGPPYGSLVEEMLKEAATASGSGEYPAIIKLHLAGIGDRASPIWAQHQEAGTYEVVWGTRDIKRKIGTQISLLREELAKNRELSTASIDTIVAKLGEVATVIKRSKQDNVAAALRASAPGSGSSLELGSVGALEHIRIQALDQYDRDVRYEQVVAITTFVELGLHYTQLSVSYKSTTGELIGEVRREVLTPASVATSAIMRNFETHAREQINGLPYEMVLAVSPELTSVWAVLDNTLTYVRSALEPPRTEQIQTSSSGEGTSMQGSPQAGSVAVSPVAALPTSGASALCLSGICIGYTLDQLFEVGVVDGIKWETRIRMEDSGSLRQAEWNVRGLTKDDLRILFAPTENQFHFMDQGGFKFYNTYYVDSQDLAILRKGAAFCGSAVFVAFFESKSGHWTWVTLKPFPDDSGTKHTLVVAQIVRLFLNVTEVQPGDWKREVLSMFPNAMRGDRGQAAAVGKTLDKQPDVVYSDYGGRILALYDKRIFGLPPKLADFAKRLPVNTPPRQGNALVVDSPNIVDLLYWDPLLVRHPACQRRESNVSME